LDYHLLLAGDLKPLKPEDCEELAQRTSEVKRMLSGLVGKLNAENLSPPEISSILGYDLVA
jgi:hypothetical protein